MSNQQGIGAGGVLMAFGGGRRGRRGSGAALRAGHRRGNGEYLGERAREDGTALPRPRDRVATWSIAAARR